MHRVAFRGRLWGRRALRRLLLKTRPDLIAAHTHHALALCHGLGVPLVVHRRVDFVPSRVTVRRYNQARHVVAVSAAVANVLRRAGVRTPLRVVYDAVLPLPIGPWPRPPPRRLVAVGALVPHKGHIDLLRAMTEVDAELVIAGQGPERGSLERFVQRHGLTSRVTLLGQVAEVAPLLHRAHAFVHPSREEGLGQAVIEALSAGCPTVTTWAGGLAEVVEDRGTLVPSRSPRRLAQALRRVLERLDEARKRALAGRAALVERHAVARMVEQTEAVYTRAMR